MVGESLRKTIDEYKVLEIFRSYNIIEAAIERQWSRKGEGHVGAFSLGMGFAKLLTCLAACNIPYKDITAQQWRAVSVNPLYKEIMYKVGKEIETYDTKQLSIKACEILYPGVNLLLSNKCTVPSDGIAEAILIGHYLKQNENSTNLPPKTTI